MPTMPTRRSILVVAITAGVFTAAPAFGRKSPQPFDPKEFAEAQNAGRPILVVIGASWCPICKAQQPILGDLLADPKFKDLIYFIVDFDSQKNLVKQFGARMQSTLIVFKGNTEEGRSVGDTNRTSIAALLGKAL